MDIEEGVTAELDWEGHLLAIEVIDVSKRLSPKELTSVSYDNLLLASLPQR